MIERESAKRRNNVPSPLSSLSVSSELEVSPPGNGKSPHPATAKEISNIEKFWLVYKEREGGGGAQEGGRGKKRAKKGLSLLPTFICSRLRKKKCNKLSFDFDCDMFRVVRAKRNACNSSSNSSSDKVNLRKMVGWKSK